MTRYLKIYSDYRYEHSKKCKIPKANSMNREGYGYIKRRLGLLSNELKSPTYLAIEELSNFIAKTFPKS